MLSGCAPVIPYLAILLTILAGYLIIKRWSNHMVLLSTGFAMLILALLAGFNILPKGVKSTGLGFFDLFQLMNSLSIKQLTGTSFMIMTVGGFAKYMDQVGAARSLVRVASKPLTCIRSPWLVMVLGYLLAQTIVLAITSAGGLAMLLCVVLLPVLLKGGVSVPAAAAIIATSAGLNIGPVCGNTILAAGTAGIDPVMFFVHHQLPNCLPALVVITVLHVVVQRYYDRRNDDIYDLPEDKRIINESVAADSSDKDSCPLWYALLPVAPVVLLIVFSPLVQKGIKLNTAACMYMTWLCAVVIELFRLRDTKKVFGDAMAFFKGMGTMLVTIVSLIICAEVFAAGLKASGLISLLLDFGKNAHMGLGPMSWLFSTIVGLVAMLTGSAVGPFTSFCTIAPDIVAGLGVTENLPLPTAIASITMPMHTGATLWRAVSPVAGCVLIVAGTTGLSPLAIVRRTAIPMLAGYLVVLSMNYILFQ